MPAGATYEPIATTTLGSAANTITFTSIGSTYTDLRLVVFVKATSGLAVSPLMQFNADTATNYSYVRLVGNGTSASSAFSANNDSIALGTGSVAANGVGLWTADIFSYAGSTYKTALVTVSSDNNGSGASGTAIGMWRSTSAITRVDIKSSNNFEVGTMATIYGIKAA